MVRKLCLAAFGMAFVSAVVLNVPGCGRSPNESPRADKPADAKVAASEKKSEAHGHKPGAHGGIIVEIGRDNYHAEAVFEKGGLLRLYTLGRDEAKIIDVESQDLKAYVKEDGESDAVEMDLKPVPRAGDKPGRTSQFIGKLRTELVGKAVAVTIPIIVIDGERFRLGFTSTLARHDEGMPSGVSGAAEKELYLKPGGIYTLADIKANGNMTASQRFKTFKAKHDMRPKAGEKICPVTFTKANPDCWWIVGGKRYEFCCPPCVDEFVTWAKTQPEIIREPAFYIKKDASVAVVPSTGKPDVHTKVSAQEPELSEEEKREIRAARAKLTPDDQKLAAVQEYCPIMEENRLGIMGPPYKVMVKNQPVLLCCEGCRSRALANPEKTLTTVAKFKAKVKAGASD